MPQAFVPREQQSSLRDNAVQRYIPGLVRKTLDLLKGVGRAEQEMKPNEVVTPVPKPVSGEKDQHHEHGIEREEIRSQRDGEVALAHHDVTAAGGGPEASDSAAEEPGPKGMGKLVAEDIDPHWLWEQKVDDQPTSRPRKERHPGGIGVPSGLQDHP